MAIQALILSSDAVLVESFTGLLRQLGIQTCTSADYQTILDRLKRGKYEALILDFDTVPQAESALNVLRSTAANHSAVLFAVATGVERRERALRDGVHFLLQRPLELPTVRQTLQVAYDLMYAERRQYFRCVAELPVILTRHRSGEVVRCSTINVSSSGVAVTASTPLRSAETLDVAIDLPHGFTVRGSGIVIWDDKHGRSGIRLSCSTPEMRRELDAWLESKFSRTALNTDGVPGTLFCDLNDNLLL